MMNMLWQYRNQLIYQGFPSEQFLIIFKSIYILFMIFSFIHRFMSSKGSKKSIWNVRLLILIFLHSSSFNDMGVFSCGVSLVTIRIYISGFSWNLGRSTFVLIGLWGLVHDLKMMSSLDFSSLFFRWISLLWLIRSSPRRFIIFICFPFFLKHYHS